MPSEMITGQAVNWLAVLLDATIKGTVILMLAGGLTLMLRKTSAAVRHMAWLLAVVALLGLPVLSATLPQWQIHILPEWTTQVAQVETELPRVEMEKTAESTPAMEEPAYTNGAAGVEATQAAMEAPRTAGAPVMKPVETTHRTPGWQTWVLVIWGAGVVVVLVRLAVGTIGVWRLAHGARRIEGGEWEALISEISRQLGLKRRVILLVSRRAAMPMTWGIVRPAAMVPVKDLLELDLGLVPEGRLAFLYHRSFWRF